MDEDVGRRLLHIRTELRLTQKEIATSAGVSPRTWEGIERGEALPSGATLLKIAGLGFSPSWILAGIEPMRISPTSEAGLMQAGDELVGAEDTQRVVEGALVDHAASPGGAATTAPVQDRDDFALLPRYEARAAAGHGRLAVSDDVSDMLAFRRDWLRRMGINPATSFLLAADGDSMEPSIPDGALMLVDGSPRDIRNGAIYVIIKSGAVVVKRVQFRIDDSVVLISDNPIYERETISRTDMNDLHFAGRVVWIGRAI